MSCDAPHFLFCSLDALISAFEIHTLHIHMYYMINTFTIHVPVKIPKSYYLHPPTPSEFILDVIPMVSSYVDQHIFLLDLLKSMKIVENMSYIFYLPEKESYVSHCSIDCKQLSVEIAILLYQFLLNTMFFYEFETRLIFSSMNQFDD